MHPLCYIKTDNIEVEVPEQTEQERKILSLLENVEKSSHADLDELFSILHPYRVMRGNRDPLKYRRMHFINSVEAKVRVIQRSALAKARIDAFIGPLTIQQRNGHPF
jgi:hypothetical protein